MEAAVVTVVAGVALTGLVSLVVWIFKARPEVRAHDVEIRALDEGYVAWDREERKRVARALSDVQNEMNRRGLGTSGPALAGELREKQESRDRRRDEIGRVRLARDRITATEDFRHWLWRHGHAPTLHAVGESERFTAE